MIAQLDINNNELYFNLLRQNSNWKLNTTLQLKMYTIER